MELKPGYKTTEAAATLAASLAFLIAAIAGHLPPRYAALGASVSVGLYSLSRGLAKLGASSASSSSSSPPLVLVHGATGNVANSEPSSSSSSPAPQAGSSVEPSSSSE